MGLFGSKENPEDIRHNAMSMMERNQPKAAVSLFNKILKQDVTDASALFNKGLALNQMRKYSDAITCFDKLLEINHNSVKGKTTEDVSKVLKGQPNTTVNVLVERVGVDKPFEVTLTREEVNFLHNMGN